ncbi:MAG: phosphopyruvate hydratase [bacterium]|nr:phosphopyruvate hydratase [bacterium]
MSTIKNIYAQEILDSRGNPTVRATVVLDDGTIGEASVPSGASTGIHEAHELRDGDKKRYGGKGVLRAVENINGEISELLAGEDAGDQKRLDKRMIDADGTRNKERLGANAILGVSLAVARAVAQFQDVPLYVYLRGISGLKAKNFVLPTPMMNVINGGAHADSGLDVQEFMIIPQAKEFNQKLRVGVEIFHALASILKKKGYSTAVGDEGGYAPKLQRNDEALEVLAEAVAQGGYKLNSDIKFGLDVAASEFYSESEDAYVLNAPAVKLSRERLISLYSEWAKKFPISSIEDPLNQDDWQGWTQVTEKLGGGLQIVGDDFFVTNIERLQKGIDTKAANAILIKVNQIGTLSETLSAITLAQKNNYGVIISHRSGETADTFIADLAVGTNAGQIKTGSLSRSERVEKYNRLLVIERELSSRS